MSNNFLNSTETKDFFLHSQNFQVIQAILPPYSLDDQETTVLVQHVMETDKEERGIAPCILPQPP